MAKPNNFIANSATSSDPLKEDHLDEGTGFKVNGEKAIMSYIESGNDEYAEWFIRTKLETMQNAMLKEHYYATRIIPAIKETIKQFKGQNILPITRAVLSHVYDFEKYEQDLSKSALVDHMEKVIAEQQLVIQTILRTKEQIGLDKAFQKLDDLTAAYRRFRDGKADNANLNKNPMTQNQNQNKPKQNNIKADDVDPETLKLIADLQLADALAQSKALEEHSKAKKAPVSQSAAAQNNSAAKSKPPGGLSIDAPSKPKNNDKVDAETLKLINELMLEEDAAAHQKAYDEHNKAKKGYLPQSSAAQNSAIYSAASSVYASAASSAANSAAAKPVPKKNVDPKTATELSLSDINKTYWDVLKGEMTKRFENGYINVNGKKIKIKVDTLEDFDFGLTSLNYLIDRSKDCPQFSIFMLDAIKKMAIKTRETNKRDLLEQGIQRFVENVDFSDLLIADRDFFWQIVEEFDCCTPSNCYQYPDKLISYFDPNFNFPEFASTIMTEEFRRKYDKNGIRWG